MYISKNDDNSGSYIKIAITGTTTEETLEMVLIPPIIIKSASTVITTPTTVTDTPKVA